MIAHGLQMQLMGIRSVVENFSVITTGIFMSGYFTGYFLGSNTTPKLVQKVGHIRVFAAFASLASLSAHASIRYNKKDEVDFCKKPFEYIYQNNLKILDARKFSKSFKTYPPNKYVLKQNIF